MSITFWWEHLDSFVSPFIVVDERQQVLYANESFLNLFSLGRKIVRKKETLSSFLFLTDGTPFSLPEEAISQQRYREIQLNNSKGDPLLLQYRVTLAKEPFGLPDGEPVYLISFHDVSLEFRLHQKHSAQMQQNKELIFRLQRNVAENDLFIKIGDIDTARLKPLQILASVEQNGRDLLGWRNFAAQTSKDPQPNLCELFASTRLGSKVRTALAEIQNSFVLQRAETFWSHEENHVLALRPKNGDGFWVLIQDRPGSHSEPQFLQSLSLRLTEALENHYLTQSSITDALTGVFNRGYFDGEFERLIQKAFADKDPLTLLIIDADHFKSINDNYGHPIGDKVLMQIAATLKNMCRDTDLVARVGGEEFAIILADTSTQGARVLAERVRQKISDNMVKIPNGNVIKVTVSIGLAELAPNLPNAKALYEACDRALYDAKKSGRNQVKAA